MTSGSTTHHPAAVALQTVIALSNAVERELARLLGLHATDYRALSVLTGLTSQGTPTMGRLAAALGSTPATTSAIVARLERRGFAVRHRGGVDRRQVTLEPTPESWARIMDVMRPLMEDADAYVSALPPEQQRVVADFLDATTGQLARHLDALASR